MGHISIVQLLLLPPGIVVGLSVMFCSTMGFVE